MEITNSYLNLGPAFYENARPVPVPAPKIFLWNAPLAGELGLPEELTGHGGQQAAVFSGNTLLEGSDPVALAYAGHQFGQFSPKLGDGRAHLLGEVTDLDGNLRDLQLKGSGKTGFSRGGDGRCAIGPAVREYIMGEAMHALGIPTTRCLAVVTTGEMVHRDTPLPGAVVTRVAGSHLRVGTLQYFAARGQQDAVRDLCEFTIARHDPDIPAALPERWITLLDRVIDRQIRLVVEWMRVGFIHGVMNTDNTALSGETIDFGPCAMLGNYDPRTVYSSIDQRGRYAFGNQPGIAQWNMARLAECLLPLVDNNENKAVEKVRPLIAGFPERYQRAWSAMMARKVGLGTSQDGDDSLVADLLKLMQERSLDYTVTFHRMRQAQSGNHTAAAHLRMDLDDWYGRWDARLKDELPAGPAELMAAANPVVIPRNHHMERVLQYCVDREDPGPAKDFLHVLRSPYEELPETRDYQDPPDDGDAFYQTFCGT